jgi:predicted MPP superfamily phosphohydrolase
MPKLLQAIAAILIAIALVAAYAFAEAQSDPIVHRADVALTDWPAGARPVRVALLSDIHIASATMDAARLTRIVAQVNALHPDLVLIAGDFIFGHDPHGAVRFAPQLVEPLSKLNAPLGTIAVPGNHDHWTGLGTLRAALAKAHVTLLANQIAVRGPLAIVGIDDEYSHHAKIASTMAALGSARGAHVALSHSPDIAPLLPAALPVLLAGHTHCGQVVLPLIGPVSDVTKYGARYRCGLKREGRRTTIVTGGLGTSGGPFRLGAPPDMWLISFGP